MNSPLRLGITGGIGSGKSTVCKVLEVLKIPVYYADDRAKLLMNSHRSIRKEIISLFGDESYNDQILNRTFIASRVFENKDLLAKLNEIVHPIVAQDFKNWIQNQNSVIVAKEAALLFETNSYKEQDYNWLVTCPEVIRINRVLSRDPHRAEGDVRSIINNQWPDSKKREFADFEIHNDGSKPILMSIILEIKNLKDQLVIHN